MRAEDFVDDVRGVVDLLVHHEAKDSHLRGAAVVELDRALGVLLLLRPCLPLLLEGVDERHVPGEGSLLLQHYLRNYWEKAAEEQKTEPQNKNSSGYQTQNHHRYSSPARTRYFDNKPDNKTSRVTF